MNPALENKARELDPEFWASWDKCPERYRDLDDYQAMVIQLDNARIALGLPEGIDLLSDEERLQHDQRYGSHGQ